MSILSSVVGTALTVGAGIELSKTAGAELSSSLTTDVTTSDIQKRYSSGNSRLVDFTITDGTVDDKHRAWLKLENYDDSDGLTTLKADLNSQSTITPIIDALTAGYNAMIITQFQEGLQEKQSVMQSIGDNFALTFSGKEPNLVTISGLLPFDYKLNNNTNWYITYVNAYKFIMRASILAKYKLKLRLIFPDFSEYTIYPVSFTTSMNSQEDNLIPFSMGAYVIGIPVAKSSSVCPVSLGDNNPADVISGALSSLGLKQAATAVNTFANNPAVKTITSLNKLGFSGAVGVLAGSAVVAAGGRTKTSQ